MKKGLILIVLGMLCTGMYGQRKDVSVNVIDSEVFEGEFEYTKKRRFDGHWAGIEMGFNGYLDKDFSTSLGPDEEFMELNSAKSWNVNINFLKYDFGIYRDKIGIVTGLGLEFNDYKFDKRMTIMENDQGIIVPDYNTYQGLTITKTKLSTTHITVPLLMEFQIPVYRSHRIFFSGGVIGGVRIGAHTKVVYKDGGKEKDKVKDDFNLRQFRYGLTARVGYRGLKIFANYYMTSLFEENKGPELYPFTIGLVLLSF